MNDSEPIETTAIAVRAPMSVGQAMSVDEIVAQVNLVHKVMEKVMQEGTHFGTIPGCGDKKCLLQPGAQKLTMTFRLAPEYEIQETNLDRGHKEYRVVCTLKTMGSGSVVGQGVGCCSSMESKYRFRGGARKCPECGKEAIIMGKKFKPNDPEPGWLCWTKKNGCGATWPKGDPAIESQSIDKIENESPADTFNTVLKMAKKRAFVDATITATAASDIFTQDAQEDDAENDSGTPEGTKQPPAPEKPSRKAPAKESAPNRQVEAVVKAAIDASKPVGMTPEDRAEFINILQDHAGKAVKRGVEQLIRFLQTRKTAKGRLLLAQGQTLTDLADADLKSLVNGWNSVLAPFSEFAEMNPPPPVEDAPDFTDKVADAEAAPKGKGEPDWLKDEPRSNEPDDPGDDTLQVEGFKVKGILQAVTVQQGTTARGAWTAHHCHVDGQKYTTFDKKIGEKAVGLKNKPVQIVFERTTKGNGVLSISAA